MNKYLKYAAAAIFVVTLAINIVVTLDDPFVMLSNDAIATGSSDNPPDSSTIDFGSYTPYQLYLFTEPHSVSVNDCPKKNVTISSWESYDGSLSVGATTVINGVNVTIEVNASGEKGYYKTTTYTTTGVGYITTCVGKSWTNDCRPGKYCPDDI